VKVMENISQGLGGLPTTADNWNSCMEKPDKTRSTNEWWRDNV